MARTRVWQSVKLGAMWSVRCLEARVSVSEKGPEQERSQHMLWSLPRRLSDSGLDVSGGVSQGSLRAGVRHRSVRWSRSAKCTRCRAEEKEHRPRCGSAAGEGSPGVQESEAGKGHAQPP